LQELKSLGNFARAMYWLAVIYPNPAQKRIIKAAPTSVCTKPLLRTLMVQPPEQNTAESELSIV
jgi:hypothetical protein